VVAAALAGAAPAAASTGIGVYIGYADSSHPNATHFPTPWAGSPNTIFEGCPLTAACVFDAGAVQVINNSGGPVTVNSVAVKVGSCTFSGWPSVRLPNGGSLIVTQTSPTPSEGCNGPAQLDSSDSGNLPLCAQDGIQPVVYVTIDGTTTSYTDSGKVLNTGGVDGGVCSGNESSQWTKVGTGPCAGSQLSLLPLTQTHGVGTTATVTATFSNTCDQPLQNVSVQFAIPSGPNAGRTGSGTTNASGQATFSYVGVATGTDTVSATVTNTAGSIPSSNTVAVNWIAFAPGGGAFVIGDLEDVSGAQAYWWGAQWWKTDHLGSGLAPASFKGFENGNASPWCGQAWTTRPGNSSKPPKAVPPVMAVLVASHITKNGPVISGDIVHIVLVQTNRGYAANPGHIGTGKIIATIC
jgi:hypothetical protein